MSLVTIYLPQRGGRAKDAENCNFHTPSSGLKGPRSPAQGRTRSASPGSRAGTTSDEARAPTERRNGSATRGDRLMTSSLEVRSPAPLQGARNNGRVFIPSTQGSRPGLNPAATSGRKTRLCLSQRSGWLQGLWTKVALLLSLITSIALAQKSITTGTQVDKNGNALEMRSVFDPMPPTGYAPVRVVATNGGDMDSRWNFSFRSQTQKFRAENTHSSQFQLIVPAHLTQSATFLVPLAVNYGDSSGYRGGSHQLHINLDADGMEPRDFQNYDERVHEFPAIAISKTLADTNHSPLKDEVERRLRTSSSGRVANKQFGSTFAPDDLPEEWRGLSGFDALMISSSEWLSLKPGQRLAIIQWMRLGGRLDIYASTATTFSALGIPVESDDRVSLGQASVLPWDGKKLDADKAVARYWGYDKREKALTEDYTDQTGSKPNTRPDWSLLDSLGVRSFASWQVIVFLVIFGVLVGPVNLFVLAPPGKRHKLFVTTPLLSVGASLLMVVIILFQDGIGGMGARLVIVNVVPEEAAAYVTQEQASRTGVLLGGGFELKQPALIEPLALPDSPWVKLKSRSNSQTVQLSQEGAQRGGNYFQSRAEQGQILRAVISTRSRLELKAGLPADAPPEIISALGFTLDTLFYVDAKGLVWKSPQPLGTGQQVKLVHSDEAALRQSWAEMTTLTEGQTLRRMDSRVGGSSARSTFFATAKQAPGFTLDTLTSIRWKQDHVALFGPLAQP